MNNRSQNSAIRAVELTDYRVLAIGGDDRVDFLQGQLTQDVTRIDATHSALAGWATAKGRLLAVGQLMATPDALLWPLPADIVAGVHRRLGMFLLRAKAEINITEHAVFGLVGLEPDAPFALGEIELGGAPDAASTAGDLVGSRLVGDPTRAWLCGPAATLRGWCDDGGLDPTEQNEWRLRDTRAGLPAIVAATSEAFIPQMLNLDLLDGISFTKGCYVGQEIVARTQNLGRIKRRMYRFRVHGTTALEPAAAVYGPDNATGRVVSTALVAGGMELTAVIAIDQSRDSWYADDARTARLELLPLPYAVTNGD